jgi:hypothetical protein
MYKSVDVQTHPQAPPLPSRRWIRAAAVIAAVAVIGFLGTMTIGDRYSTGPDAPSAPPVAAQTQEPTLAELNEMWAAADAHFAGLELPTAVVHLPAETAAQSDAAMWASADHAILTGD